MNDMFMERALEFAVKTTHPALTTDELVARVKAFAALLKEDLSCDQSSSVPDGRQLQAASAEFPRND